MSTAVAPNVEVPKQGTLFGHPKGLYVLFVTEMWERMSYYGMRSLLLLYMVDHLFVRPDVGRSVLGFNALKGALEQSSGALTTGQLGSLVYGLYTAFVYLTPFLGGQLADRVIGRRRAVVLGGALMAIGHFMMASETMFLLALFFLILGNGCFKPNISTQVGLYYPPGDPRRDQAFSIFYIGINFGAALAPLVCGTLGQRVGWHWGFGAAGVGMVLGLIVYLMNQRLLVKEPLPTTDPGQTAKGVIGYLLMVPVLIAIWIGALMLAQPLQITLGVVVLAAIVTWLSRLPADERPRVIVLAIACLIVTCFWAVYEQQGNTLQLWADRNTVWPTIGGFTIPSTWYQAFNPIMIFFCTLLLTRVWTWQNARGQEPASITKMGIGLILLGLGFVVMLPAAQGMDADAKRSLWWLVGSTLIYTFGELYLSPIGLSFVTKVAPARIMSMLMGVWFLANFFGNFMSGKLGTYWETMSHANYFLLMMGIAVVAGLVLLAMARPLNKIVAGHESKSPAKQPVVA